MSWREAIRPPRFCTFLDSLSAPDKAPMRYLDTKTVEATPATQQLTSAREQLVQEIRNASGKAKGKGKGKVEAAPMDVDAAEEPRP